MTTAATERYLELQRLLTSETLTPERRDELANELYDLCNENRLDEAYIRRCFEEGIV